MRVKRPSPPRSNPSGGLVFSVAISRALWRYGLATPGNDFALACLALGVASFVELGRGTFHKDATMAIKYPDKLKHEAVRRWIALGTSHSAEVCQARRELCTELQVSQYSINTWRREGYGKLPEPAPMQKGTTPHNGADNRVLSAEDLAAHLGGSAQWWTRQRQRLVDAGLLIKAGKKYIGDLGQIKAGIADPAIWRDPPVGVL